MTTNDARDIAVSQDDWRTVDEIDRSAELVAAVREHAERNYSRGWDVVVECYEDAEILEVVGRCRTVKGAIRKLASEVGILTERRREIESTIW